MNRIPPELVEEIKARNDIEEVISSYVTLKRAGSNLVGLCPFHSEKTPSFNVSPSRGIFKCFGCGQGGDVITFIMKAENVGYREALELLARRAGITVPDDDRSGAVVNKKRIYDMNRDAAKYFHACLFETEEGKKAYAYLKNRGYSDSLIRHFGLGYSPDSFHSLRDHMRSLGYKDEELVTGFLCRVSSKNQSLYDLFRSRVMVPILDLTGNVIGFGGRVLDNSKPKYINTDDSPVFKKGKNLFAMNFAKNSCSESVILCEGYMDVIALHGAGFSNAVACLGTALTPDQARFLKRYTKMVYISLDSDEAGKRAAANAFNRLTEVGLEVKMLEFNGAKDPDEFIKKFGKDRFSALLSGSNTWFEYQLKSILSEKDLSVTAEKVRAKNQSVGLIASFYSDSERDIYIGLAAKALDLPADGLKKDVDYLVRKGRKELRENEKRSLSIKTAHIGDKVNPDYARFPRAASAEENILRVLLRKNDKLAFLSNHPEILSPDDFVTGFHKRVFEKLLELYRENDSPFDFGLLGEFFTADEMSRITGWIFTSDPGSSNFEKVFSDCVSILKKEKKKSQMDFFSLLNEKRNQIDSGDRDK